MNEELDAVARAQKALADRPQGITLPIEDVETLVAYVKLSRESMSKVRNFLQIALNVDMEQRPLPTVMQMLKMLNERPPVTALPVSAWADGAMVDVRAVENPNNGPAFIARFYWDHSATTYYDGRGEATTIEAAIQAAIKDAEDEQA